MALNMKRVTDLQEKTEVLDEDLFAVGNNGTPSLRKTKWSTIWNKIVEKFRTTLLVQNATTADTTRAASAAVAKNLQDQITELNTKMNASSLNDRLLKNHEIGSTLTFNELLSKETVTFFTNWTDGVNFPGIYGSGLMIPGLDNAWKYIIYLGNGSASFGLWRSGSGIKWTKLT